MRRHRLTLSLALAAGLALPGAARAGQSAIPAAFADPGLGGRVMAMGGAGVAADGRATDLAWNPAGLTALAGTSLWAMQGDQFGLVPSTVLGGARPWGEGRGVAAALLSGGDALLRENTLLVALGQSLGPLALGATLRLRHASFGPESGGDGVDGSAYGAGLDLGVVIRQGPYRYGLVLDEALSDLRWSSSGLGDYHEGVPPTLRAGLGLDAAPFSLAVDLELALESERAHKAALGLEWRVHPVLALRGGMSQRLDTEELRFLTLGAGLGKDLEGGRRLQLDSAYSFHDLGGSLRVEVSLGL
ncbi:MAG: hypothetical protein H6693_02310 [Candidatus Latescibacteria bacterium]|nr:hypothetical protein [Candidatus Latescibacterota bacterium]